MPTYVYKCAHCKAQREVVQSFGDDPLLKCSECGKKTLRRVIGTPPVIFKGGGWYTNDTRDEKTQVSVAKPKLMGKE